MTTSSREKASGLEMDDSYEIKLCGAARGCPLSLYDVNLLAKRIQDAIIENGWPEFFHSRYKGSILFHTRLKVAISGCPNACSEPQIRDIGLIAQKSPRLIPENCQECKKCLKTCKEEAITMKEDHGPLFNERCLACGQCISACPYDALTAKENSHGIQVSVGGKLGRHPQFAIPVRDFTSDGEVVEIINTVIDLLKDHAGDNEIPRLGNILTREMIAFLKQRTID